MVAPPTILAIASPPGQSLRGIIRISGPDAFTLFERPLGTGPDADCTHATPTPYIGRHVLTLPKLAPFSVLMIRSASPRSYTGEDTVELHMPGNPSLLQRVQSLLIESGRSHGCDVRAAEPGEFTARAFLNGKIDLTQAEGVAATIAARSDAELAAAHLLTGGRLSTFALELAEALGSALALVEAGIDFTDQDDVVAISPSNLHSRLSEICRRLRRELDRAVAVEHLRAIPHVTLVGAPNAGKSALFNALLGRERAVVSNIAGTTRDVLAEPLTIHTGHGRAEIMLVDLAGLDQADASTMNFMMQQAAEQAIARSELILRCIPCDEPSPSPSSRNELIVRTKSDLMSHRVADAPTLAQAHSCELSVSAMTGAGLDRVKAAVADRLADRAVSLAADVLALQPRHDTALRSCHEHVCRTIDLVEPQRNHRMLADSEVIAVEMRSGLNALISLAGEMTPDDILGRIFATFCIGK